MTVAVRGLAQGPAIGAAIARAPRGARLTATTLDVPALAPLALAGAALAAGLETACWLRPADRLVIVGIGRTWATEPEGPDRWEVADRAWGELVPDLAGADRPGPAGPVLLGGLGFGGRRHADDRAWAGFPVASLVLPQLGLVVVDGRATLTVSVPSDQAGEAAATLEATWARLAGSVGAAGRVPAGAPPEHPCHLRSRSWPDRPLWDHLVRLMAGAVGRGRLDKVVLARRVELELDRAADPVGVLAALAAGAPEGAAFLFRRDGRTFLGATPERLASTQGRAFRTVAIAGSIRRGRDAAQDAALGAALLASDKDREEHAVVVAALRTRLGPISEVLRVPPDPSVLALRDVQHLVTPIDGTLRERAGPLALAALLHPTPAVGGAPTDAALSMLAEHEGFDRGWYAGPVGWLGPDGDGELMVALRSGVLDGSRAWLFAGCGIVADSDPEAEWEESRMKLRPMLAALGLEDAE